MKSRERFVQAAECHDVDRPPCWLMRQAGRYLPEYRELREKFDFLTLCERPDLAIEISLQPWLRFKMDAVVVFSDLLLPAKALGVKLHFEEGHGPRFEHPIRSQQDVDRLTVPDVRRALRPTLDALSELRLQLADDAALVGFVGSPWTVAAYLVEGGSGDFSSIIKMMKDDHPLLMTLIDKVTSLLLPYAVEQVRAGSDAIQIFDTWGGLLDPQSYEEVVLPSIQRLVEGITKAGALSILFVRGSEPLFHQMTLSGAKVLSLGPGQNLAEALGRASNRYALQGNLDPEKLLGSPHAVREAVRLMLRAADPYPGYIANLGHGVMPLTPIASVEAFVETVKGWKRASSQ